MKIVRPSLAATRVRQRRGAIVIEAAVIAVVVGFLALGMLEVARGVMVKEALGNAARIAARSAAGTGTNASATTDAQEVLKANGFNTSDVTVSVLVNDQNGEASTAARGSKISVTVSLPVHKVYWTTSLYLLSQYNLSETVVMMKQH